MANQEHINILNKGVKYWNSWKKGKHIFGENLSGADLRGAYLKALTTAQANDLIATAQRIINAIPGK